MSRKASTSRTENTPPRRQRPGYFDGLCVGQTPARTANVQLKVSRRDRRPSGKSPPLGGFGGEVKRSVREYQFRAFKPAVLDQLGVQLNSVATFLLVKSLPTGTISFAASYRVSIELIRATRGGLSVVPIIYQSPN